MTYPLGTGISPTVKWGERWKWKYETNLMNSKLSKLYNLLLQDGKFQLTPDLSSVDKHHGGTQKNNALYCPPDLV